MKKTFWTFLLLHLAMPLFSQESNQTNTQACIAKFQESEEFKTGGNLSRTYNGFNSLSNECKTALLSIPAFITTLEEILQDYDNYLEEGKTIDEQMYRDIHRVLGKRPDIKRITQMRSNSATAQQRCGGENARDFRDQFPDKLPPIRDQGSIGWCYAYSVSDLVSFNSGKVVSARSIAQANNLAVNQETLAYGAYNSIAGLIGAAKKEPAHLSQENTENVMSAFRGIRSVSEREGGIEQTAFLRAKARDGFCLERDIPSGSHEESDIGATIEVFQAFDSELTAANTQEEKSELARKFCNENTALFQQYFPNGFKEGVVNALLANASGDSFTYLSQEQCKDRVDMGEYRTDYIPKTSPGSTVSVLDGFLDRNEISAVGYQTDFMGQERLDENGEPLENYHSSTIIGRRFNEETGRCQYLLRNSWGTDCSVYPDSMECEKGNIWVSEDDLDSHSLDVTALVK